MKKYVLLFVLLVGALYSNGQDLDNVKKLLLLKQWDKAKPEIDAFLNVPKNANNAEALYFKAYVYHSLAMGQTKPAAESKSLYVGAFDALQKYAAADAKATLTTEEKNSTLYNIYYGFYDLGVKTYNQKDYPESFDLFKKALEVHDYIYTKKLPGAEGMKFTAHDTDIVWNLAVLSNELKNKNDAMVYYKKIADADLKDEKYAAAYDELILKYKKEKNVELFTKYVTSAKKHYPVDMPYWENQEVEFALTGLEDEALLIKYEELTKSMPTNYAIFYNYAIEIDKFLNTAAAAGKEEAYKTKMEENFKKALALKSTIEVNLQLANMYHNKSFDLQDKVQRIKGTKPAEVKAKNDLNAAIKSNVQQAMPYAEEAIKLLAGLKTYKFTDKANYKLAYDILINANKYQGNTAKANELEAKKLEVEKL